MNRQSFGPRGHRSTQDMTQAGANSLESPYTQERRPGMQTVVQVVCNRGKSLRDAIANDRKLKAHHLAVVQEKKPGRSPGWTKMHTTEGERSGSMNIQWDAATSI